MSFESLGLRAELLRALSEKGYAVPTPVQAQAIPFVLAGRDILAGAQTGTGKTAGFALPLLQRLSANPAPGAGKSNPRGLRPVRALILTPTRELALQVEESVRTYGRYLPHRSLAVFGGVGIVPQIQRLRGGIDIVVATPGRLLDHITQGTVDLGRIETLVLDEADRMLDMGFIRDIRKILAVLPRRRQTLFFSATFPDEIRKLADELLQDPASVQVTPRNAAAELVAQAVLPVDKGRKRALLAHLVESGSWRQVLVFTRTKHGANRLATQLADDGITSTAIHGNKSQTNRVKALRDFKQGAVRVLVATDIAARGLDIDQLPHVVNYDLPYVPEDYVHRIGRTGRAGNEGTAISLVSADEHELLDGIERLLRRSLPREVIAGFEPKITAPSGTVKPTRAPGSRPGASGPRRAEDRPRREQEPRRTSGAPKGPRAERGGRPGEGASKPHRPEERTRGERGARPSQGGAQGSRGSRRASGTPERPRSSRPSGGAPAAPRGFRKDRAFEASKPPAGSIRSDRFGDATKDRPEQGGGEGSSRRPSRTRRPSFGPRGPRSRRGSAA